MIKASCLLSAIVLLTSAVKAQEKPAEPIATSRAKEIWVGINSLSPINLSLGYKHQVGAKWFMSYRLFNLQYSNTIQSKAFNNESVNYSAYVGIGIERRHALTDELLFFHGPEISGGAYKQFTEVYNESGAFWQNTNTTNYRAGLGYRIGMLLQFKTHGFISLHLAPYFHYTYSLYKSHGNAQTSDNVNKNLSINLYNSPEFSIGYRF